MQYLILFLEGIITFISPCLLPLLPVYISFFASGESNTDTKKILRGALGFVTGFSFVFTLLGAFAGFAGGLLRTHQLAFNVITGTAVILFGLQAVGVVQALLGTRVFKRLRIGNGGGFGQKLLERSAGYANTHFFFASLFGSVFAIAWTPCVGVFLGSALMIASRQGSAVKGIVMLLCYSLGLGLPFLLCALLMEQVRTTLSFIKKHYGVINIVSGMFLIFIGILMITGLFDSFLGLMIYEFI